MYQNNVKKYKFVNALDFTSFYFKTDDYNLNKNEYNNIENPIYTFIGFFK